MKRLTLTTLAALLLMSCGQSDQKESNSRIVSNQVGRFAMSPAQNGYPPMVLDTATGCVMVLNVIEKELLIDEVKFVGGTNSCDAMKQLLVTDTLSRVRK